MNSPASSPLPHPTTAPTPVAGPLELALSAVLQGGVLIAGALVIVGAIVYLASHSQEHVALTVFRPGEATLTGPAVILRNAIALDGPAIMQCGVLVLILTPLVRVLASLILFAIKRDALYVVVTLIVLTVLVLGLLGIGASHG